MLVHSISACITTARVAESRDFYVRHFGAKVTFDCGWYINLEFGQSASLQFMAPQPSQPACDPAGLMYNFRVADADAEYRSLTAAGLAIVMPLEDHPWGDRGFAVQDPNGVVLYIYSEQEPDPGFEQYRK
jgi:uncharacterized glyoxalase superfamily protein PhnB